MDTEFLKDLQDGLVKMSEITNWLINTVSLYAGKEAHSQTSAKEKEERNVIIVESDNQNLNNSKKGDDEIMKHIRKRKDNRWEARIMQNGKRVSIYGKTQKEVYEKIKRNKQPAKQTNMLTYRIKFSELANIWLEKYKKIEVNESTYRSYKTIINNQLSKLNKPITQYTTTELQDFLNNIGGNRTKEYSYMTIKQIFRKALELEIVKKDVSQFLVKGRIKRETRNSFSIKDQKLIFENLKNNSISRHILAYLLLGARLSELKSIKKENIRNNYVLICGTKTKNAQRWVKVSDKYQNILLSYKEPLFNCEPDTIRAKMQIYFKKIGVKGTAHMLRHTYSTNLYYLGADDNTRKQYLGHSSILITNDIYTHLDPTISKQDILNIYGDLYPEF